MRFLDIFKKRKIKNIPNKKIDESLRVKDEDKSLLEKQIYGEHVRTEPPKNKSLLSAQLYGKNAKSYDEAAKSYNDAANYYANIAKDTIQNKTTETIEEENSL